MSVEEVCPIAAQHCANLGRLIRIELIKALQIDDGPSDCFASTQSGMICDQLNCFWRDGCMAVVRRN